MQESLVCFQYLGRFDAYAKRSDEIIVEKAIAYNTKVELNQSFTITERHKFWKLAELANQSICKTQAEKENQKDVEILFDGGRVIKNYSENRVQIVFDTKPQPDVISNLKHNGFRWSPRFSAWQRQLTNNAYYAVSRVIPITIEQLMKGENK